jgi:sensor histidine kinase regulating citrate/malate metabolism
MTRRRLIPVLLLAAVLAVTFAALKANEEMRTAWERTWMAEAEDMAAFARQAMTAKDDFALVDRISGVAKRDDVAYVVILVPDGRAKFNSNPAEVGKTYDSEYARRALAAKETVTQEVAGRNIMEVDVPLENAVMRMGFSYATLAGASRALLTGVILCWICAIAVGLLALKPS